MKIKKIYKLTRADRLKEQRRQQEELEVRNAEENALRSLRRISPPQLPHDRSDKSCASVDVVMNGNPDLIASSFRPIYLHLSFVINEQTKYRLRSSYPVEFAPTSQNLGGCPTRKAPTRGVVFIQHLQASPQSSGSAG